MAEFVFEVLVHILLRMVLGLFVAVPIFCGTLVNRLAKGCSILTAIEAAWKNMGCVFAACFDG
jgi:hypothetical protein